MQGRIDRVKVGDLITDTLFNSIIDRLAPLANLTADGPYLIGSSDPYCGHLLHLAIPSKTSARLTSDTSPYSWEEVDEASGGTWVTRTVGGSGTNNAHEINNVAGLAGNVYWLTWTGAGDYRFQAIRVGPVCTEDADHVCICGCLTPLTKTPTIADSNGTHTLTWDGAIFVTPTITQSLDLYDSTCTHIGTGNLRYRYQLSCVASGGGSVWRLHLRVPVRFCFGTWRYTNQDWTAGTTETRSDIPSGCDESLTLDFTLPAIVKANDGSITGLASPGGGGSVSVVF